jgi:hypothetical protein
MQKKNCENALAQKRKKKKILIKSVKKWYSFGMVLNDSGVVLIKSDRK